MSFTVDKICPPEQYTKLLSHSLLQSHQHTIKATEYMCEAVSRNEMEVVGKEQTLDVLNQCHDFFLKEI